jgi:hypothetical protein
LPASSRYLPANGQTFGQLFLCPALINLREPAQVKLHFFDKAPVLRKTGALPCAAGAIIWAARKRGLTQHHGKMAQHGNLAISQAACIVQ